MTTPTLAEILTRVSAPVLATQNPEQISIAASVGRICVVSRLGGIGTILDTLGPIDGSIVLDRLTALATTTSSVKWAMVLVNAGELDFGSAGLRAELDVLATNNVITVDQAARLKSVAERPDPITEFDVRVALWAADGTWLGG